MKPPPRPRPAPGRETSRPVPPKQVPSNPPVRTKPTARDIPRDSPRDTPRDSSPAAVPPAAPRETKAAEVPAGSSSATKKVPAPASFAPKISLNLPDNDDTSPLPRERSVVATGLQARIAERSAMARRQRWIRVSWILLGVVVLSGAIWAFFFSSMLALDADRITIDHVEVAGASNTVDLVAVQREVNKAVGTPLPRLATTALRDTIKDIRGVRDVVLTRDWPRGLHVQITARQPVIAIPDGSGKKDSYVLLDSDAVQVGRLTKEPKDLPVVDVPLDTANERIIESVLAVVNALPPALSADVATVQAASQDNISLKLRDGATVRWGGYEGTALKIEVLNTLRNDSEAKKAKIFDVSAPTAPITK